MCLLCIHANSPPRLYPKKKMLSRSRDRCALISRRCMQDRCTCIYIYIIHTHAYTYICIYIYIYVLHTHLHTYTYTYTYT